MTMEEKKEIAKRIYKELGFETENFQIEKIEEINADIFLPTDNQRGIGGVIIGNDGSYHVCGSINPLQYYIDEFKNGVRDNMENNDSLKLSNGKYAEDLETKQAFENYMTKVDKYNEQVANGEKPDVSMGDLLNEYQDTFTDETLEERMKKIEEEYKNKPKDDKLDRLITDIDKKIDELDNKDDNNHFYKNKEEDTIWWVENPDKVGEHLFSFDKERIFNLFRDYPNELTPEQKEIFDNENPYWADFFKDRTE